MDRSRRPIEEIDNYGSARAPIWRLMSPPDLPAVDAIATNVHPAYPEDRAVFAERLRLFRRGCFVLDCDGTILGYVLSHPWKAFDPPSLNALVGQIPSPAETYYLHDIALLPEARGVGHTHAVVFKLIEEALNMGLTTISLVAVGGTVPFWRAHRFVAVSDPALTRVLAGYDAEASFMVRNLSPGMAAEAAPEQR
jgi:hypothetical protein